MKQIKSWLGPFALIALILGVFATINRSPRVASVKGSDGPAATPFTATTVDGMTVSLADYKGKVLLIDFWASWCPPCREEAPNVVSVYRKYHDQGFDVLGVSLDQDKSAMSAFEKEIGMTWPQVFDADNGNAMADKYNVQAIPTMLLIDGTTGKVLAENPRGEALAPAVAEALRTMHY